MIVAPLPRLSVLPRRRRCRRSCTSPGDFPGRRMKGIRRRHQRCGLRRRLPLVLESWTPYRRKCFLRPPLSFALTFPRSHFLINAFLSEILSSIVLSFPRPSTRSLSPHTASLHHRPPPPLNRCSPRAALTPRLRPRSSRPTCCSSLPFAVPSGPRPSCCTLWPTASRSSSISSSNSSRRRAVERVQQSEVAA